LTETNSHVIGLHYLAALPNIGLAFADVGSKERDDDVPDFARDFDGMGAYFH